MEIIATNALISINETFIVQLVSFLIFLYVMNRLMFRPLISTVDRRKTHLDDLKTDIDNARSDLVELHSELDAQRHSVREEAESTVRLLEQAADKEATQIFEAARSQITQLRQETEKKVQQAVTRARAQLRGEVDAVTAVIMEKVLQRSQ